MALKRDPSAGCSAQEEKETCPQLTEKGISCIWWDILEAAEPGAHVAVAARGSADRGWGHDPLLQRQLSWWGINLLERGRKDGGAALGSQGLRMAVRVGTWQRNIWGSLQTTKPSCTVRKGSN